MIDKEVLLGRIEEIKKALWTIRESDRVRLPGNVEGSIQSTLAVLVAIYGNPSPGPTLHRTDEGGRSVD